MWQWLLSLLRGTQRDDEPDFDAELEEDLLDDEDDEDDEEAPDYLR